MGSLPRADTALLRRSGRWYNLASAPDARSRHLMEDCHTDPVAVQEADIRRRAASQRFYRDALLDTGSSTVAALHGNDPTTVESLFGTATLTAAQYTIAGELGTASCSVRTTSTSANAERYGSVFDPAAILS